MAWTIRKEFTFDAAHRLPHHEGGCQRLHGHTYKVELFFYRVDLIEEGPAKGMVVDFGVISEAWRGVAADLDHNLLNDVGELENPTAENLARYIFVRMDEKVLPGSPVLDRVRVWETPTSWAEYTR